MTGQNKLQAVRCVTGGAAGTERTWSGQTTCLTGCHGPLVSLTRGASAGMAQRGRHHRRLEETDRRADGCVVECGQRRGVRCSGTSSGLTTRRGRLRHAPGEDPHPEVVQHLQGPHHARGLCVPAHLGGVARRGSDDGRGQGGEPMLTRDVNGGAMQTRFTTAWGWSCTTTRPDGRSARAAAV